MEGRGFRLRDIRIEGDHGAPIAPLGTMSLRALVEFDGVYSDPWVFLSAQTPQGETIFGFGSWEMGQQRFQPASEFEFNFHVKQLPLLPGAYRLQIHVGSGELHVEQALDLGSCLTVAEAPVYGSLPIDRRYHGLVPVEATLMVRSPANA